MMMQTTEDFAEQLHHAVYPPDDKIFTPSKELLEELLVFENNQDQDLDQMWHLGAQVFENTGPYIMAVTHEDGLTLRGYTGHVADPWHPDTTKPMLVCCFQMDNGDLVGAREIAHMELIPLNEVFAFAYEKAKRELS